MNRGAVLAVVALLAGCLTSAGCNDQTKKELAALQQQYNDLQLKYQDVQRSAAESRAKNADLEAQLQTARSDLTAAKEQVAALQERLKQRAPVAPGTPVEKFTLASDILFAPGKATLSKEGAARIRRIAARIKSAHLGDTVRVYGYTDNDPIARSAKYWKDNLDLSANRAMAVTRLLRKLGIPAERIETVAMGATHFVAPNTTRAGKARNRRVEIVIIKG